MEPHVFYAIVMSAFVFGMIFFPALAHGGLKMKEVFCIIGYILFIINVIGFNAACVKFPLTTGCTSYAALLGG